MYVYIVGFPGYDGIEIDSIWRSMLPAQTRANKLNETSYTVGGIDYTVEPHIVEDAVEAREYLGAGA